MNWRKLDAILRFLKPLYDVTERFSRSNYVTISLINVILPKIIRHASQEFDDNSVTEAANALKLKLSSYSKQNLEDLVTISTVLDPRFKLDFFDREREISVKELLRSHIDLTTDDDLLPTTATEEGASIFDEIYTSARVDEVDEYLAAPKEAKSVDVIDFWKLKQKSHPRLAKLAKQILAVQATSVASERAFSKAGCIDSARRSRLSAVSLRSNMLLNSWLEYLETD